jgi:ClpP class serine protease
MRRDTNRRYVRRGELLLIDERFVQRDSADRGAFFWLFAPPSPETDHFGPVSVVHIRGPLEHHPEAGADSYDGIRDRARVEFDCQDVETVVMRIDSPGGSAHGLMGLVRDLVDMKRSAKKRLIAYCDDYACSAAYAISCAADEIIVTPTSITGSIGVISTMVDVTKRDKQEGLTFVTIASGKRKSDGHIHVPISADAVAAERPRIEKLASDFFTLVSASRGLSVKKIRSYEAGIFLGTDAIQAGIADDCMAWDELLLALGAETLAPDDELSQSNSTHGSEDTRSEAGMSKLKIEARMAKLRQKIGAEKDPVKLHALSSQLGSLAAAAQASVPRTRPAAGGSPMEDDDEDEDEDEDEDDEDDEAAAKVVRRHAKGNETNRDDDDSDDDDKDDDDGDDDDDDDDEDDDDEEMAAAVATARKAVLGAATPKARKRAMSKYEALVSAGSSILNVARKVTGQKSAKAVIGALEGMGRAQETILKRQDKLERKSRRSDVREMVRSARTQGKISKAEVESLTQAGMSNPQWLKGHLAVLPKRIRSESDGPLNGDTATLASLTAQLPTATAGMMAGQQPSNPYMTAGGALTAEDQAAMAKFDQPTQTFIVNSVAAGVFAPDGKRHSVATYAAQISQQLGMTNGRVANGTNGVIR